MGQSNEGCCCDAVLTIIEQELHAPRSILSRDTPASRGIEIRCGIGDAVYALEHTVIDPYPNKRDDDQQFMAVMGELWPQRFENPPSWVLSPESLADVLAV